MTDDERNVILETLRLLAECELGRMALSRKSLKMQLAGSTKTLDLNVLQQRLILEKALAHIQSLGDRLDSLIKEIDKIKNKDIISEGRN
jgi:hypothetical protein